MKRYTGDRTIDGVLVQVGDTQLPERTELQRYTDNGFEWSYEGPEPAQLAFAILVDHLGDPVAARKFCDPFMRSVVANFGNEWVLSSDDVSRALSVLDQRKS